MDRGKERHMFPGSNTSAGFYSYYRFIMPQQEADHIFCLKGGPGVGKSTFMKKIACRMQDKGFLAEYLHCSSDPDSLDGVVFPGLHVALIDGTSPHVIDPVNPGAVDEIVNLGEYWDLDGIKQNKENIIKINAEVGKTFRTAYKYLGAAKYMLDNIKELLAEGANPAGAYLEAGRIVKEEFTNEALSGKLGNVKKQFASAITPSGIVQYIDTLVDDTYKIYFIRNKWGIGVSELLKRIAEDAAARGLFAELYYCPMEPESKIEHVVIPGLKLAFFSESRYFNIRAKIQSEIDMTRYIDTDCMEKHADALAFCEKNFETLLDQTVCTLHKAKRMHDEMEKYYIPHMNFEKENQKLEEIALRIFKI